jgi:hypothetical protein
LQRGTLLLQLGYLDSSRGGRSLRPCTLWVRRCCLNIIKLSSWSKCFRDFAILWVLSSMLILTWARWWFGNRSWIFI